MEIALGVALIVSSSAAIALAIALRRSIRRRDLAEAAQVSAVEAQQRTADLAVAAERLRILREMHDVIAHSLAIMIAQADGGRYAHADPQMSERAFATIAETGRGALADTRRILGILKHGDDTPPELTPSPDTGLDMLAQRYRETGLHVSVVRVGEVRPLPSGSRTALHRITQESLTNVLKHAGDDAQVVVTENWRLNAVTLTVTSSGGTHAAATDPFTGQVLAGTGMGLIGMRERAELLGGTLTAGPTESGFRVCADLPYPLED